MNKTELVNALSAKIDLKKKDTEKFVNELFEVISEELANDGKVSITGFGTFEVRERHARTGINPQTGASIEIPSGKAPAFKAGKALKDRVNK